MMGFDSLVIEVNPRHVHYYERMLGFKVVGQERISRRVNAPAVLLCQDFARAREKIARVGGQPQCSPLEGSLYPHFFSGLEESGSSTACRAQPDAAYSHPRQAGATAGAAGLRRGG